MNPGIGSGGGMRRGARPGGGRGRGFRHIYNATGLPRWARGGAYKDLRNDPEHSAGELGSLRREAGYLEGRLKSINEMIRAAEGDSGKDDG